MTHPGGDEDTGGTGPGRLSDATLIRLFTAVPVVLGVVLILVVLIGV